MKKLRLWPARKRQLGWMFLQYASDSRTTPKNKASKLRRRLLRHKPSSDGRHDTASQHTRKSGSSEFLNAKFVQNDPPFVDSKAVRQGIRKRGGWVSPESPVFLEPRRAQIES
jgi:hypothetical protein